VLIGGHHDPLRYGRAVPLARFVYCRLLWPLSPQRLEDEAFATAVTDDLQSVNRDKHLRLLHSVEEVPERQEPIVRDETRHRQDAELAGHGFAKVERLAGNIGLMNIRRLFDVSVSGAAAVAAMNLVADADVLLIDLRRNSGGDPAMVALLCSYLFDEATHLNDLYFRPSNSTTQYWTHPFVPGRKFGDRKPIYVLVSNYTFSGAEELSYNLQQLKRATLVGGTTRGGAHPGDCYRVSDHLVAAVPSGRAINPVSGTNWEGVGVQPDIAVSAEYAFGVAYSLHCNTCWASARRGSAARLRSKRSRRLPNWNVNLI
jgi:C-terminal processing protease CtpA/Prc